MPALEAGQTIDPELFRSAMSCFATGVTVVTALEDDRPVGFTCQTVVSLSLDPPLLALAPAKSSTSWPRMARAGAFCVNVLSDAQAGLARRFAVSGGDKFAGVAWRSGMSSAPVLDGCLVAIHNRLELVHDAGDHEIVIGRVVAIEFDGDATPLLFFRSNYRAIGESLGANRPPET